MRAVVCAASAVVDPVVDPDARRAQRVAHYRQRTVIAQQQTSWPQFRANPQLTGIAASPLAPALKVMWTFDAGEAIESSAAIVDGAVYVGSAAGELIALDFQTGAVRWRYKTAEIGESSPAVANGVVYVGDLTGTFHAVDAKTGKALWTFKTMGEIRSSPVVVGDRVLIGSYDRFLYALSVAKGTVAWKVEFQGYVHATPAVLDGVAYISGCDETFRGIRVADGREVLNVPIGAYMGASAALAGGAAYVGTFENEVIAIDMKARKVMWTYRHPERLVSVLLVRRAQPGACRARRARQDGSCARCENRQAALDVHDERARGIVSGHCGQSYLRRVRPTAASTSWI